jgi:DNA-binding CsgD family transcriptional regulator
MGRRRDRWAPPEGGGSLPTEPVQAIDLYPNPLSPPPPCVTREVTRERLIAGFDSLTDDEVRVARLWLSGKSCNQVCRQLQMDKKTMKKHWQNMRRKLRNALKSKD